ncbi:MAG: protein kinase [Anaerolineales bacterium]|nr:protein kinase [Anaerolineales bacterium]
MLDANTLIGQKIGRYLVEEHIAQGGMANVYRATDTDLDRQVALKIMLPELARDKQFVDRFRREAQAVARLNHPNIVTIFDASLDPQPHLVMPYVGSHNLRREMVVGWQKRRIDWQHVVGVALQISEALAHVHKHARAIHGDLKPENVLVCHVGLPEQEVVLTDFGLAQLLTRPTGEIGGTPAYLSPEQVLGEPIDGRSDLYALGVIMYEWLANGRLPIPARSLEDARRLHPSHQPTELDGPINNELKAIIMKLLAKEPPNRYKDAATVHQALQGLYKPPSARKSFPSPQPNGSSEISLPAHKPAGNFLAISEYLPLYQPLTPKQSQFIIGSDPIACDLTLAGDDVAAKHARLRKVDLEWHIEPLGQQIIYVDDQAISKEAVPLTPDKKVKIGSHFLQLHLDENETSGIYRPFYLSPTHMVADPGDTATAEVVIRNGGQYRAYYHIALSGVAETAVSWFNIPNDGIPLGANESGTLHIQATVPPNAEKGIYPFKVQLKPLASNEPEREIEGQLDVNTADKFSITIQPTVLAPQQKSWITITNEGNREQAFHLTLSDEEEELYFKIIDQPEVKAPRPGQTAVSRSAKSSSATPSSATLSNLPTIPPILRRIPYISTLLRTLSNNPLSRWLRQLRQGTRQVQGLANQLPQRTEATTTEATTTPQPAQTVDPQLTGWKGKIQHHLPNVPAKGKIEVGFMVESRRRPWISRADKEHAFTIGVVASHAEPASQFRAATLVVPPQVSSRSVMIVTILLFLLAAILLTSQGITRRNSYLPIREAALTWAAEDMDDDTTPNAAEVVARTDPRVKVTVTSTAVSTATTPVPPAAVTTPAPDGTTTAVSPTPVLQLTSEGTYDGYLQAFPVAITTTHDGETLIVGDDAANGIIRAIISFDTSAITPATTDLTGVSLFLWLVPPDAEAEVAPTTAPGAVLAKLGSYLNVDMAPGGFGFVPDLEPRDFNAPVAPPNLQIVRQARNFPNQSGQIRLNFSDNAPVVLDAIKNHDVVQFRLYLELPTNENEQAEQLHFFSGEAADEEKRPFLQFTYGN